MMPFNEHELTNITFWQGHTIEVIKFESKSIDTKNNQMKLKTFLEQRQLIKMFPSEKIILE